MAQGSSAADVVRLRASTDHHSSSNCSGHAASVVELARSRFGVGTPACRSLPPINPLQTLVVAIETPLKDWQVRLTPDQ